MICLEFQSTFFLEHYPTDDELASCLIIAAKLAGLDAGVLANAILQSHLVRGTRYRRCRPPLIRIAEGLGFDGSELIGLARGAAAQRELESYTIEAQRRGVFGSPFYFFGEEIFWGQDRLDLLERVLAGTTHALESPTHRRQDNGSDEAYGNRMNEGRAHRGERGHFKMRSSG